ncbi:MAG: beta-lactamase family protein [Promethearchaeota archaeon]|nr:MAG: beta-lactamase family protein [Candidatus Lokiarchaeota archaeon]
MIYNKKLVLGLIIAAVVVFGGISSYFIITSLIPTQESFNEKIQKLMEEYEIPSLAAGIIINDSLVWANGFGEQPDLDTVYMIGSITKTFTATAILQLNESNLVNLNDDINKYLPFDVRHPDYPSKNITIRMLLTHTAGLSQNLYWSLEYYFDNQTIEWINENLDLRGDIIQWEVHPSLEEFLNGSLTPTGPYYDDYNWPFQPGTHHSYSNAGYQLLGYLVEQVSNKSMMDYLQENVFGPLNMTSSGSNYTDFIEKHGIPYEWSNNTNFEYPLYNFYVMGAGNLRSTVPDMAKYIIAHMNQGEHDGPQLLNPATLQLMHSEHESLTGVMDGFDVDGYGLGWVLYEQGLQGHGGATPGFSSNMFIKESLQGDLGVIVMYNRGSALIFDDRLINNFLPAINNLLVEEAENLFQQALSY